MKNFGFQITTFFRNIFHDFPNSLTKSLIHKIKKHKNFYNFLTSTNRRIENKMSKIIKKEKNKQ